MSNKHLPSCYCISDEYHTINFEDQKTNSQGNNQFLLEPKQSPPKTSTGGRLEKEDFQT